MSKLFVIVRGGDPSVGGYEKEIGTYCSREEAEIEMEILDNTYMGLDFEIEEVV